MRNAPTSQWKIRPLIAGVLPLVIFFQLLSINAMAQTTTNSKGFLAGRVSARAGDVKVAFTYGPKYPAVGQVVQFLDTSTGSPISWAWDFGDGETSAAQNPSHNYSTPGFRKVTLIATNNAGSKKSIKSIMITPDAGASFVFSPMTPGPGQTVQFADTSSGDPTSWQWDFGDGATSTSKNPGHVFGKAGFYTTTLIASNSSGSKQASKTVTVAFMSVLSSSFNYTPAFPSVGQTVQFTDASAGTPTSWQWNFGDGGTSTSQNPSYSYATAGSKTVSLIATNSSGSNSTTKVVTVAAALTASFSYSPASPVAGQAVQFTDASAGIPTSWQWNFGDGATSTSQNPSHSYTTAGAKTVSLTVTNASGSNGTTKTVTIAAALTASFSYSPASPAAGQAVQFTDTSAGSPISWQWNFGDGTTSTAQNPTHTYTASGSKTVTLNVTNASSSNASSRTIPVLTALTATFTYGPVSPIVGQAVQFTDTSTGTPSSWAWTFGDGSTSAAQNPSHSYDTLGSFGVTLTIGSGSGSASIDRIIAIGSGEVSGNVYWLSPTGTASWAAALSTIPLAGTACCSLATANANIAAGDTAVLRGGTYHTPIAPTHSGTSGNRIYYKGYSGETAIIRNDASPNWYYYGIMLDAVNYITVDGIDVQNPTASIPTDSGRILTITNGAHHNEIANCDLDGEYGGNIYWWRGNQPNPPVTNNWMHHCTVHHVGHLYAEGGAVNQTMGMQVGMPSYDGASSNNTIEDCVFYSCGHHCLEVFSQYNVIKNNYFHNEGWLLNNTRVTPQYGPDSSPPAASPKMWGHRNFQICGEQGVGLGVFSLIEGNRFGHAGSPAEDDGGDGLTLTAPRIIVRFNDIFNSQNNGVLFKTGDGQNLSVADYIKFYNNTIYKSGRWHNTGPQWDGYNFRWYGSYARVGNVIINNLLNAYGGSVDMNTDPNPGSNRTENNWFTANGDPLFVDTNVSDPKSTTRPNLSLRSGSPCVDIGTHLTQANGAGSNGTKLIVDDSLFFQDGTWGSSLTHGVTHFPDWIAIGTVTNIVKIASIDYAANTILLASPMTWSDNAKIWLYSDSCGKRVLYGAGPDVGAHEFSIQY